MKNYYVILFFILILIIFISMFFSPNNNSIHNSIPNNEYIIQYNKNRCNNFKKLGPPLGPPLPKYPWPPSM